jgi:hypothetical protein
MTRMTMDRKKESRRGESLKEVGLLFPLPTTTYKIKLTATPSVIRHTNKGNKK